MIDFDKYISIKQRLASAYNVDFFTFTNPDYIELMQLGRESRLKKRYDDCHWCYDSAIKLLESSSKIQKKKLMLISCVHSARALCYIDQGKYFKALGECDIAILIFDDNAEAWCNKGVVYWNTSNYDAALESHKNAIKIDPELVESWNGIGNLLVDHFKEYKSALKYLNKAIELSDGKYIPALVNKGNVLLKLGEYTSANEYYELAFDIDPDNAIHAQLNKAINLIDNLNQPQNAIKILNNLNNNLSVDHRYKKEIIDLLNQLI